MPKRRRRRRSFALPAWRTGPLTLRGLIQLEVVALGILKGGYPIVQNCLS
jgi:hypothetical protein